ncbi:MAG: hypothetical protein DCC65_12485 [Planctomycetota bacterium]|nr:MAG: hypothetical protein DCC65_12485 [Planctomycetota bacterium]
MNAGIRFHVRLPLALAFAAGWFPWIGGSPAALAQEAARPTTSAPTTRPKSPTHAELYSQASQRPLNKPPLKNAEGVVLNEGQIAEVREAEKHLEAARDARSAGDFERARQEAVQALDQFKRNVGLVHYLTISAGVFSTLMDQYLEFTGEQREELVEAAKQEKIADRALRESEFLPARTAAAKAIEIRERILGAESADLVEPLRILGNAQTELRALDDAEKALTRSLGISERTFGKGHPRTAAVLDRMGWLRIYQGKYDEAEDALRRALFILNTSVGETPETAETMDNLGTALGYTSTADLVEAGNHKLRALVIRERTMGSDSRDAAISMSNLAWLYGRIGLVDEVIPLRRRALEVFEKTLGPENRDTLVEKSNLAQAYRAQGQLTEAMDLYKAMVAQDEKLNLPVDQNVVNHLTMLGTVCLESGNQSEGEESLRKARDKAVELYEKGEYGAAVNEMEQVALVYQARRMVEDALLIREQVYKWDQAKQPKVNERLVLRTTQLGRLYTEAGRSKDAVPVLERAAADAKALYGEGERETTSPLIALAGALREAGELDAAGRICGDVLRIVESRAGKNSTDEVYALHTMGEIQIDQKSYDLARFSLQEALDILDRRQRPDPVKYVRIQRDLARCLVSAGDVKEAVKVMNDAIQTCRRVRSPYPMQLKTLQANTLHQLVVVLEKDPASDSAERERLKDELRKLLAELRAGRALTADMKAWMTDYGVPVGT